MYVVPLFIAFMISTTYIFTMLTNQNATELFYFIVVAVVTRFHCHQD